MGTEFLERRRYSETAVDCLEAGDISRTAYSSIQQTWFGINGKQFCRSHDLFHEMTALSADFEDADVKDCMQDMSTFFSKARCAMPDFWHVYL